MIMPSKLLQIKFTDLNGRKENEITIVSPAFHGLHSFYCKKKCIRIDILLQNYDIMLDFAISMKKLLAKILSKIKLYHYK